MESDVAVFVAVSDVVVVCVSNTMLLTLKRVQMCANMNKYMLIQTCPNVCKCPAGMLFEGGSILRALLLLLSSLWHFIKQQKGGSILCNSIPEKNYDTTCFSWNNLLVKESILASQKNFPCAIPFGRFQLA